jgi:flagellar basal-body rod protein FlgB
MFIDEVTSSGAMPVLEATMRFAGARNRLLAHNIANLDTPDFRPLDVSPKGFQAQLRQAVEDRRARTGGGHGGLGLKDTHEVRVRPGGGLELRPRTSSGNILFHDRNNRDLERTVQDLVENVGVFRVSSDLLRSKYELLRVAMTER